MMQTCLSLKEKGITMKNILTGLLLCLSCALGAETIPLDDFIKHGDYLDIEMSPDGKHLLARLRAKNRVILVVMQSSDGQIVGGVKPNNNDEIHTALWVNNNRFVYELAEKQTYLDAPIPQGELYASNIDGTGADLLYGYRASDAKMNSRIATKENTRSSQDVLSIMEEDEDNILIIEYPWSKDGQYWYDNRTKHPIISKLNILTGRKKKLETLPHGGATALASKKGEVNFISWYDEQNVSHSAYRNNVEQDWIPLESAFDIDIKLIPIALSSDASKAYLSGKVDESEVRTLFELELSTGKYKQLFSDMQADISDWIYDTETDAPVVAISYPDKFQYHYNKVESQTVATHKMLAEAFSGQEVMIKDSSQDGNILLIRVKSDVNPGEYYLFDVKNKDANFLWANRSWIDPRQMQQTQTMHFTARDEQALNGYLTLPIANKDNSKPPMVVLLHGGPHQARDYWEFNSEVQMLANRGYAVLQVNFRGSAGYGDKFVRQGFHQWGGKVIEDIIDATQTVIASGQVDGQKVCVYGASFGGYAALMSAVRAPELYQCAIGYAGIYDLGTMFSESDIPDSWGGKAYLEDALGHDAKLLSDYSPINHVDSLRADVMLIHGEKDNRVPFVNAEKMQTALKARGKTVASLNFGQSAHGVFDEKDRLKLYAGVLAFLDKHIGK
jgi:dipeptidyl aminopeptidase/acylaminoacyl peptidase